MDPRYLRQLAEIIDLGSLSVAATSLGVSQPTLSRNIRSLETRVGAPVLRRGRHGVTPTTIGAALAREGRSIRDALQQAELDLRHWKGGLDGRLRIGAGTMLAHSLMAKFLEHVARDGWNVALRIDVERADRLIDRVRSRELDAAIVQIDPNFPKEGLRQVALFEDRRAYFAGARHPLARQKTVGARDIARCRHITVGAFRAHRATLEPTVADRADGLTIELSGDVAMALHLLSTGQYVAALPEFVMSHLCDGRRFVRLRYRGEMPSRTLSIWHRDDMGGRPLIREFCRRMVAYVSMLQSAPPQPAARAGAAKPAGAAARGAHHG
ncbi:MAG TPA: LysR family transcriptional regulator [Alphaproteobacteria bacterium]|nr:LysR family transcriptional regulator [Alphaproteobacteria bacterium]